MLYKDILDKKESNIT